MNYPNVFWEVIVPHHVWFNNGGASIGRRSKSGGISVGTATRERVNITQAISARRFFHSPESTLKVLQALASAGYVPVFGQRGSI